MLSPFVKWVGGKRNVIKKYLYKYIPQNFNDYYEPFIGGGAMLYFLEPKKAYINDINSELINAYRIIKSSPIELIRELNSFQKKNSKDFYYLVRNKKYKNNIKNAAKFIYINKACFNGIYRVNSKGEFNVPFNSKTLEHFSMYNQENILNISKYFNEIDIKIFNEDYYDFLNYPKKNDFVFVDSPYDYDVLNGFDNYDKNSFGIENHIKLSNKLKELDKRGVKFMATNHDTKLINELYSEFNIIKIKTNRFINSNPNKRKLTGNEVIITNYKEN